MSPQRKSSALPFVAAALILLGGLFLALRPNSEAPSTVPPPPMDKTAETTPIDGIDEKVTLLDAEPSTPAPSTPKDDKPETAETNSHSFDIRIEENRLASPTGLIRVKEGDAVTLNVTASQAEEFHLHGYDLLLKLTPGETATLHFTADRAGRFEFELERAHIELGAIEVYPR